MAKDAVIGAIHPHSPSVAWFPVSKKPSVRDAAATEVSPVACSRFMPLSTGAEIQGGRSRARRDDRAAAQSI